eukprot:CAMPEP_0118935940 /NCGR_PEP_ID=MMETSP1169-20130426/15916_1 /TAXON_ID=36882 /ORGANISM="Pyramimonas obovata, Strain CCMP722" /LENGTH=758 /DNA_ID=CAMNT_0006879023 /DNA_START=83 /DNA_END=2359 /DNA_ORIENTATION=-
MISSAIQTTPVAVRTSQVGKRTTAVQPNVRFMGRMPVPQRSADLQGRKALQVKNSFSRDMYLSMDDTMFNKYQDTSAPASLDGIGENVFKGAVADRYLKTQGLTVADLDDHTWVKDFAKADKIAKAVAAWATDRGASSWCHWFQPMAATYRHGQTAQVQNALLTFGDDGKPKFNFSGKQLLQSETDGSSYPNGGMRATHTAAAYLTVDPESPIFLRGDSFFVPALFVSWKGDALDEKTPLHRACQAMSRAGSRMFKACGVDSVDGLVNNIGLEQELFLIPRECYFKRMDLQLTGRTVMGKMPPRGQEGSDHYMGPINTSGPAWNAMKEIQAECFKIGIPLITRHREVAPNQYEFAPMFGTVVGQIDNNLMVMQIMEEVAAKHGLVALLQEKPFAGINGSGKHNNWSLATKCGVQLLNPGSLTKAFGKSELFPIVMACMLTAIDKYGDLMRMGIATPGNDFRLGGMEASPAVMSTYLGEDMTSYLEAFMNGEVKDYVPKTSTISLGVDALPTLTAPAEDRNRTSPFPYGGSRFEFRACGSSQNLSLVNAVLNTIIAEEMNNLAEKVETGESPIAVAQGLLKEHLKIVFNGNGYAESWPAEATEKGLFVIPTQPEAIRAMTAPKNVELFTKNGIFTEEECAARQSVQLGAYVGVVEMEALCMIDMMNQHVIPSAKKAGFNADELKKGVTMLEEGLAAVHAEADEGKQADLARHLRLDTMIKVREVCDAMEAIVPEEDWTIATYKELLFLDQHMGKTVYAA